MAQQRLKFTLAVYLVDRAYGGPEEGGWWYDTGKMVRIISVHGNADVATARCRRMNELMERTLNEGRRSIGSVLSEGRYAAEVHGYDGEPPPAEYPKTRPHYE